MSPEAYLGLMLACLFGCLLLGFPMAFTLAVCSVIVAVIYGGTGMLSFTVIQVFSGMISLPLVALPLFIFIANVLERSGIAEDLYTALRQWLAPLPGALAIATVLVCTIVAAMSGVAAAGVVIMGIIALPLMLKRGYHKDIALAPIMAGGALGILIPPSVVFILYGMMTRTSIGRLFAGGLIPGIILSLGYMIYIGVRCYFQPHLAPPLPPEERVSLREKIALSTGLIAPFLLIFLILGTVFLGIASITEAAAVGAAGAMVCVAIKGKLSWTLVREACYRTLTVSCMIMWIIFGAKMFATVFIMVGTARLISEGLMGLAIPPIALVLMMQFSYILLGCITEEVTMIALTIPIYAPILTALGFDPVWFGVLFLVNLQMGYLTPPFGYCLFYMKGVAPPEVSTVDLYHSIWPFLVIQLCVLMLVLFLPQLALWLPETVFGLK